MFGTVWYTVNMILCNHIQNNYLWYTLVFVWGGTCCKNAVGRIVAQCSGFKFLLLTSFSTSDCRLNKTQRPFTSFILPLHLELCTFDFKHFSFQFPKSFRFFSSKSSLKQTFSPTKIHFFRCILITKHHHVR